MPIHVLILFATISWLSCAKQIDTQEAYDHCMVDKRFELMEAGHAGCMIIINGKLLVVKEQTVGLSPPAGHSEPNETAQCTAHREAWEEVGVNVTVGKKLIYYSVPNFYLFECTLTDREAAKITHNMFHKDIDTKRPVQIQLIDPLKLDPKRWRFSYQLPDVQKLFLELTK